MECHLEYGGHMCDIVLHKHCTLLYYSCPIIEGISGQSYQLFTATHNRLAQGWVKFAVTDIAPVVLVALQWCPIIHGVWTLITSFTQLGVKHPHIICVCSYSLVGVSLSKSHIDHGNSPHAGIIIVSDYLSITVRYNYTPVTGVTISHWCLSHTCSENQAHP